MSAGCASKRPIIGAWRTDGFSPAPTDKIALTVKLNPSPEDAQLGEMLTNELQRLDFNLVPQADADYTLVYAVEDDSTATYIPRRDFAVSTPVQTSQGNVRLGNPVLAPFAQPQPGFTAAPSLGPTVVVYHTKGIRLYLYTNPQTHSGKFETAWTGSIEAGENISADREPLLIAALLKYFGQNYVGRVTLDK
ncbi:MAG TPA: hypothetical protein VFY06_07825 [Verrucomicrobiae bacterium]|nr:hypothetical protein [Verrucomicrobiae bacterium]